jgi:tRNA G26 N,N-dimethylase Trm1
LLKEETNNRTTGDLYGDIKVSAGQDGKSEETKEDSQNQDRKQRLTNKSRKIRVVQRLLSRCIEEYDDIPFYFTSDEIASRLKMGPPSLETIVDNLSKEGFRTSPTGLSPTGFKTVAKINEVMSLFKRQW